MKLAWAACLPALIVLLDLNARTAAGQTPDTGWEIRPKVVAAIELRPQTRVETWGELQHGVNFSFQRWRTGALLSRRFKPIEAMNGRDIDENNTHYLVAGSGYEYLHTVQTDRTTIENRIILQATFNVHFTNVLLSDRNRGEWRWVNGAFDVRYRNKLVLSDRLQSGDFRYTPYVSGEVYYDRNEHSWNQNQYGVGVQFPYRTRLMLDTYILHQNCSNCSQPSVNMVGVTLNLYFRRKP